MKKNTNSGINHSNGQMDKVKCEPQKEKNPAPCSLSVLQWQRRIWASVISF